MYFYLMFKHFNAPFRVILQYPQSKGEILLQKKNFFCILSRMEIYLKRLIIYQSGIKINISST